MAEEKIISTKTNLTITGSSLGIFTFFTGSIKSLKSFILTAAKTVNGVLFKENELEFQNVGYDDISFSLNNSGELIIKSDSNKSFTINADGELIMEETI